MALQQYVRPAAAAVNPFSRRIAQRRRRRRLHLLHIIAHTNQQLSDVSFLTDIFPFKGLDGRDCNEPPGEIDFKLDTEDFEPDSDIKSELCSGEDTDIKESVSGEYFFSDSEDVGYLSAHTESSDDFQKINNLIKNILLII